VSKEGCSNPGSPEEIMRWERSAVQQPLVRPAPPGFSGAESNPVATDAIERRNLPRHAANLQSGRNPDMAFQTGAGARISSPAEARTGMISQNRLGEKYTRKLQRFQRHSPPSVASYAGC
jgi:hypothetical protein